MSVEIKYAWFGTEQTHVDKGAGGKSITDILKANMKNGQVHVPANALGLFGVDPTPGVVKNTAIAVAVNGKQVDLRCAEGQELHFPPNVQVNYAWYGTEAKHVDVGSNNRKIMDIVKSQMPNSWSLHIPANANGVFGVDPCPGTVKVTAINVTVNGKSQDLRAPEGQDWHWVGA